MMEAFRRAEFSSEEIDELLQLLAGLLHLSNVSFTEGHGDLLELQGPAAREALALAAGLLGLERGALRDLLRCRRMNLKRDVLCTRRNEQQSVSARSSLAKFIYSCLFDYIVQRLNAGAARQMQQQHQHEKEGGDRRRSIGSTSPSGRMA